MRHPVPCGTVCDIPPPPDEISGLYDTLRLYLVKPSKYDDDGYVIRYWKGVLPSNTLACLYGLSEDVRKRGVLGQNLKWEIFCLDETVEKINTAAIVRAGRRKKTKTIICLAGVQSNQFPRAADLAVEFREAGLDVLMGGFHISGILATMDGLSPELTALTEAGVSLTAGEAEGRWESILRDALNGTLKPVYNFLASVPDLSNAPMPRLPLNLLKSYAAKNIATLDCGRGCPFQCSFCTVINVQGRLMRFRPVDEIIRLIRKNHAAHGITHYFFTDDNFCRNKNWEALFDALSGLRAEGIPISFMIQVDTQSYRIKDFISKAAKAGCSQVFIGMESLNPENLENTGKKQNKVESFKELIGAYHREGIVTHLAYIIGFPSDSEESVREDILRLRELGAEQASFFMLTPLPGSEDYKNFVSGRIPADADLNNFDSFHETFRHSRFGAGAWKRTYDYAWKSFYGAENMKRILKETGRKRYWQIFANFIWYKHAIQVEGGHPMIHGFLRRKGRRERRKIYPRESRAAYAKRRILDFFRTFAGWFALALEMEEVWLATRPRTALEERVIQEFTRQKNSIIEWRNLKTSALLGFYRRAAEAMARRPACPGRISLWLQRWNFFSDRLTYTRSPMRRFWLRSFRRLRAGKVYLINPFEVALNAARESAFLLRFLTALVKGLFS